jgi:hypothetical protein
VKGKGREKKEGKKKKKQNNEGTYDDDMASEESLGPRAVAANVAMMAVSSLAVGARVLVSAVIMRNFWIDDGQLCPPHPSSTASLPECRTITWDR